MRRWQRNVIDRDALVRRKQELGLFDVPADPAGAPVDAVATPMSPALVEAEQRLVEAWDVWVIGEGTLMRRAAVAPPEVAVRAEDGAVGMGPMDVWLATHPPERQEWDALAQRYAQALRNYEQVAYREHHREVTA